MSAQFHQAPSPIPIVPVLTATPTAGATAPAEGALASLRREAALLRERQQRDFEALRAEMSAELSALQNAIAAAPPESGVGATQSDFSPRFASRRTLLKWGGVGAAAALAAGGGASLSMPTAHAANGNPLTLGSANTAELITVLTYDGSETKPTAFKATICDNGLAINGSAGNYNGGGAFGVLGGALDGATAVGVSGKAGTNGIGTYGIATGSVDSWGVWGDTDAGIGLDGVSGTGIDLAANGTGRVFLFPTSFTGAPTTGTYSIGEQIRDKNGNLLICVASGTPGTWVKAASVAPGAGGPVHLLSAPIRLLDTRLGIGKLTAGSTYTLQVTGVVVGTISVPNGATGVIGNVTVVSPTAGGDLRLYPGGAAAPGTSSLNFASGQVIANGVTVGLSASGKISIKVDMPSGNATHVLFDASGYVM